MDSVFLFCYPVWQYFEDYIKTWMRGEEETGKERCCHMFNMIDARYRQRGFEIFWLTFGDEQFKDKPDPSHLWSRVNIKSDDNIISAGITAWDMFGEKRYAESSHVFKQLGDPERLVVGGFHAYDCVEHIAQFAYQEMGLEKSMVDIDITELMCLRRLPPTVRTSFEAEGYLTLPSPGMVKSMEGLWRERPWLAQRAIV